MPLPPWTIEMIRRGITDVAKRASDPETLDKLKSQATEILQDLPETAARGFDAVMRSAEASKESVQKWASKHTATAIPVINASGELFHQDGSGVPIADSVIESGQTLLRGDCLCDHELSNRLRHKLEKHACFSSGHSVLCASSFSAALTAFSQLVESRPLVIHRSHAVRLPNGQPLPDAFGTLLPVIQEVGGVGEVSVSDFDGLDAFCVIVAETGQLPALSLLDFADRDAMQAVVLPVGTIDQNTLGIPSAKSMFDQGADFVIMPGNALGGGPECGLIIGPKDSLDTIQTSPAWNALTANVATQAMMSAACELSGNESPVQTLLQTSEANLQSRADRMSQRLRVATKISDVSIGEAPAKIIHSASWTLPSRQIRLKHTTKSAADWASDLKNEFPAVFAGIENEYLVVDLRWVNAASDNQLATLLGGMAEPGESNQGSGDPE